MKGKKGFPLINDQGYIRIDTVNALSFENLKNWIKAVLESDEPCAGGERDDLPHSFLAWVYHQIDPYVRKAFEDAIIFHLKDFTKKIDKIVQYEYADELLLLTGKIFRKSPCSGEPVDLLLYMSEFEYFKNDKIPNLHWRVLQTLAAIKYKGNPAFWINQYKKCGEEYASITITGISLTSIFQSIDFVKKEIKTTTVFKALIAKIPFWVEKFGTERIEQIFTMKDVFSHMSQSQREELRNLGKSLKIDFTIQKSSCFNKWRKKELNDFIEMIDYKPILLPQNNHERRQIIEDYLRDNAINKKELKEKNVDYEIIEGLKQLIIRKRMILPFQYRKKFLSHIYKIIESINPAIKDEILESFHIIKQAGNLNEEVHNVC